MLHGDLRLNLAEQYLLMDMFEISTSETQPDLVCYDDLKMKYKVRINNRNFVFCCYLIQYILHNMLLMGMKYTITHGS